MSRAADRFLADDAVVTVDPAGERFTTTELLAVERRILTTAARTRYTGAGLVPTERLRSVLAERPTLAGEQKAMVIGLTRSGHGLQVVVGAAGTGKTFALDAAAQTWEQRATGC